MRFYRAAQMLLSACALTAVWSVVPSPALAADRNYSITDFSTIHVTGTMHVIVTESYATTVRVSGEGTDVDTLSINAQDQVLDIKVAHFGWGSSAAAHGPLTVYVTTPHLREAIMNGSGTLDVAHMRDPAIMIALNGSGQLKVGHVEAEHFNAVAYGAGRMTLEGKADQANLMASGSGTISADGLLVKDLDLAAHGTTNISAFASRAATVEADGASDVHVAGSAACTVHSLSAGMVSCGSKVNGY